MDELISSYWMEQEKFLEKKIQLIASGFADEFPTLWPSTKAIANLYNIMWWQYHIF